MCMKKFNYSAESRGPLIFIFGQSTLLVASWTAVWFVLAQLFCSQFSKTDALKLVIHVGLIISSGNGFWYFHFFKSSYLDSLFFLFSACIKFS